MSNGSCQHEFVDIGVIHNKFVCRKCDIERDDSPIPEEPRPILEERPGGIDSGMALKLSGLAAWLPKNGPQTDQEWAEREARWKSYAEAAQNTIDAIHETVVDRTVKLPPARQFVNCVELVRQTIEAKLASCEVPGDLEAIVREVNQQCARVFRDAMVFGEAKIKIYPTNGIPETFMVEKPKPDLDVLIPKSKAFLVILEALRGSTEVNQDGISVLSYDKVAGSIMQALETADEERNDE